MNSNPTLKNLMIVSAVVAALPLCVVGCFPFLKWSEAQPHTWSVPADSSAVVWSRARLHMSATGRLVTDSEDILQSEATGTGCAVTFTRLDYGDTVRFEIVRMLGTNAEASLDCKGAFLLRVRDASNRSLWDRSR